MSIFRLDIPPSIILIDCSSRRHRPRCLNFQEYIDRNITLRSIRMTDILPRPGDLEATWRFVEIRINQLLGRDESFHISATHDGPEYSWFSRGIVDKVLAPTMYMEVYTAMYNYCVHSYKVTGQHADKQESLSSMVIGTKLHEKLRNYLKDCMYDCEYIDDWSCRWFCMQCWRRFAIGGTFLNNVMDYMNVYWLQKEQCDGKRRIFEVDTLCFMIWIEIMFEFDSDTLIHETPDQIDLGQDCKTVQKSNVASAIKSFAAFAINPQDSNAPDLNMYIEIFEKPFLASAEKGSRKAVFEAMNFYGSIGYSEPAVDGVWGTIDCWEEDIMVACWAEHTKKALIGILETVYIIEQWAEIKRGFLENLEDEGFILREDNLAHCTEFRKLSQRIPSLTQELADVYQQHIRKRGENEISKLIASQKAAESDSSHASSNNNGANSNTVFARDYVKKLLELYNNFREMTSEWFSNDLLFCKALDNGCRAFMNSNEFARPPGSPSSATSKNPEMFAKCIDELLKEPPKAGTSDDMSIEDVVPLLTFLDDKDSFETHCRRLFGERVMDESANTDADEETMIHISQNENRTVDYTDKITKMFQDLKLSKVSEGEHDNIAQSGPDTCEKQIN